MHLPTLLVIAVFAIGFAFQLLPCAEKLGNFTLLTSAVVGIVTVAAVAVYWLVLRQIGITIFFR